MQTTSHFIGIELKAELLSDVYVKTYNYIKENNIEKSLLFQNPLSPHITLYYLENVVEQETKEEIKDYIRNFDINYSIKLSGFNYFFRGKGNRFVLYFTSNTNLPVGNYRNILHKKYNRDHLVNNKFSFSPHITFLRIKDSEVFEKHRKYIENIINEEIQNINNLDLNTKNIFLYAVNSKFKEEIQIKL